MITFSKQWVYALCLVLALYLMAWYSWHPKQTVRLHTPQHQPDAIINTINSVQFGTNGHIIQRLQSVLLQHYPHRKTSILKQPHLTIVDQDKEQTWHIKAEHAKIEDDFRTVTLWGHVNIYQIQKKRRITTSYLIYQPKQQIAHTHALVTFTEPGAILTSHGFHANLKTQKIELLSHAKGRYDGS